MVLDLIALENHSKVWIYQGNRELNDAELAMAREPLFDFLEAWTAHNKSLLTYGNIFHRRFLCIFVDEGHQMASGCSIDASVHFIEKLGAHVNIDFFDRQNVCYLDENERVRSIGLSDLKSAFDNGLIGNETIFFNNLVKTKNEFLTNWTTPLKDSWIHRFVK